MSCRDLSVTYICRRKEALGSARRGLGSRQRSKRLHVLQKDAIHDAHPPAPLQTLRRRGVQPLFTEKVLITVRLKATASLFGLLRPSQLDE